MLKYRSLKRKKTFENLQKSKVNMENLQETFCKTYLNRFHFISKC